MGMDDVQITFSHSHAFEGAKAHISDEDQTMPCHVEFADGVVVMAKASSKGDDILLDVPTYRTAAGNDVEARSWRMVPSGDGDWRAKRLS